MNLQFDSLDELKDFLAFTGYTKKTTSEITVDLRVSDVQLADIVKRAEEQIEADEPRAAVEASIAAGLASPFASGQTGGETTDATHAEGRRRRRTKAEIAADEAAKLAPPVTFDKPADSLDNLKTDAGTPAEGTAPPSDIDHLRRCREFISEHSMATYEKSFALADLAGKNIMAFTDADRAKHGDALDLLAANPGV